MIVTIPKPENPQDHRMWWCIDLLRKVLAFDSCSEDDCAICFSAASYKQPAVFDILASGGPELDLTWSMTSPEREAACLPVRVPICKGLLGHRVFIIREGEQARFNAVQSLADLAGLVAVQEQTWPDVGILRANGLPVQTVVEYESIFARLEAGDFDYFPRSVTEPRYELALNAERALALENHLLLRYHSPLFFFVNVRHPQLRERLEAGLRQAVDDGSFDQFFYNHPTNKAALQFVRPEQRRCLELTTPAMTPQTAALAQDKRLWYPAGIDQMGN